MPGAYAGKPQPAADRELESAEQAIAMWQALWEQYSICLKPLLEGDAELAGVKPKLLQRGLAVGKQLILVHGLARRVPPATLWQEIHAYYRLAEMMECAVQAVSDDLAPHAVGVSCYSTYSHALLLALADPCSMTVRQIEIADRWLSQWARKVFPYAEQRETEGAVAASSISTAAAGASLVAVPPRPPRRRCASAIPASSRPASAAGCAVWRRARTPRSSRSATTSPSSSRSRCSRTSTRTGTRPAAAIPRTSQTVELCGGGVAGAYFRVCGRTFDRKDPLGRLTYQGSQHLATLGALTDYDRYREEAERDLPWERWQGRYEWREAALSRVGAAQHRWFLEQLVTLRDDERTRLAQVTRVALDGGGGLAIELKLWPGSPRTVAVRPQSSAFSEDPPLPAIELVRIAGRARVADRPPAHVRARPAAAVDGLRSRAPAEAGEARAARRRLRALHVRRDCVGARGCRRGADRR